MVLVECALEGGTLGTGSGAGSLLAGTGSNSSAAHQVIIFLVVLSVALLLNTPDDDSQNTDDNGTADTHDNTDDDLLVRIGDTGAGVAAVITTERGGCGRGGGRSGGHDMGHGATANRLVGSDGLDDGSLGGGRGVRCRGTILT